MRSLFLAILLAISPNVVKLQSEPSNVEKCYNLFISGKMESWAPILDSLAHSQSYLSQHETQLQLLNYYYGLIGHYLDKKQTQQARELLTTTNNYWQTLVNKGGSTPLLKAYKANLIGYEIALSPLTAPFSYKSMMNNLKNAEKNVSFAPSYINILCGNIYFYMPSAFGGDKNKALSLYLKAKESWLSEPQKIKNNWMYVQLLITIGFVYEKIGDLPKAHSYFKEATRYAPHYPMALKKLKDT